MRQNLLQLNPEKGKVRSQCPHCSRVTQDNEAREKADSNYGLRPEPGEINNKISFLPILLKLKDLQLNKIQKEFQVSHYNMKHPAPSSPREGGYSGLPE